MRTGKIIGGIITAAGIVCTGSVLSGASVRLNQEKKQKANLHNQFKHLLTSGSESLNLKAQYEKVYHQTMHSMNYAKNESLKTLSKSAK